MVLGCASYILVASPLSLIPSFHVFDFFSETNSFQNIAGILFAFWPCLTVSRHLSTNSSQLANIPVEIWVQISGQGNRKFHILLKNDLTKVYKFGHGLSLNFKVSVKLDFQVSQCCYDFWSYSLVLLL